MLGRTYLNTTTRIGKSKKKKNAWHASQGISHLKRSSKLDDDIGPVETRTPIHIPGLFKKKRRGGSFKKKKRYGGKKKSRTKYRLTTPYGTITGKKRYAKRFKNSRNSTTVGNGRTNEIRLTVRSANQQHHYPLSQVSRWCVPMYIWATRQEAAYQKLRVTSAYLDYTAYLHRSQPLPSSGLNGSSTGTIKDFNTAFQSPVATVVVSFGNAILLGPLIPIRLIPTPQDPTTYKIVRGNTNALIITKWDFPTRYSQGIGRRNKKSLLTYGIKKNETMLITVFLLDKSQFFTGQINFITPQMEFEEATKIIKNYFTQLLQVKVAPTDSTLSCEGTASKSSRVKLGHPIRKWVTLISDQKDSTQDK